MQILSKYIVYINVSVINADALIKVYISSLFKCHNFSES